MFLVDHPTLFHAQCLVSKRAEPQYGPYVDLGRDFDVDHQGRMYVCRQSVLDMAGLLGEPTSTELADALERVAGLEAELVEVSAELSTLREFEQSANFTLEHFGTKVRKKPGRKPLEKEPA